MYELGSVKERVEQMNSKLKQVREKLNLTQKEFAEKLEITPRALQNYETRSGRNRRTVPTEVLTALMQKFKVNPFWLFFNEGPMFLDNSYAPIPQIPLEVLEEMKKKEAEGETIVDDEGFCKVPIYDVKAAAGDGYINESEAVIDYIVFHEPYIRNYFLTTPNGLFVIEVVGDSMEPTFKNGDLIMADRNKIYDKQDGIYVIKRSGELTVKRIQFLDNEFLVISDNKLYPPYKTKEIEIVGKVIWFGRKL